MPITRETPIRGSIDRPPENQVANGDLFAVRLLQCRVEHAGHKITVNHKKEQQHHRVNDGEKQHDLFSIQRARGIAEATVPRNEAKENNEVNGAPHHHKRHRDQSLHQPHLPLLLKPLERPVEPATEGIKALRHGWRVVSTFVDHAVPPL
jgi:hypothetical protein